jgi:alkaline phosphatase
MSLSRRSLLGIGAAGVVAGSISLPTIINAQSPKKWKGKRPKNIIFCVADGMAASVVTMADYYQYMVNGQRSYWSQLLQREDVFSGWQDTRSLSSIVTDSAAASTTWGSGSHVWNGALNTFPDGTELRTLTSLMVEKGVKVGLVTTTTITHATPAGFAINSLSRELEGQIAEKYLKSGVSILMGGGNKFFSSALRKDKKDVYGDFANAGFKVVKDRSALLGLKSDKILGIFSDSHVPFTIDRDHSLDLTKSVPTLAEMATVAIENLKGNKNGFLLQIEGGKVDHACHGNDAAGALFDQIAFEEAVKVAIDFAEKNGETLVIITSDHACGGISLNGAGEEYFDSTKGLESLKNHRMSFSPLLELIGKNPSVKKVQESVEYATGYKLNAVESQIIVDAVNGKSPFGALELQKGTNAALALVLQNHSTVGFTSQNHTNDHVMVSAFGPGAQQVSGLTYNVEFFGMMTSAKGIKFQNPTMSFADAAKAMEKLKATWDPELHELYADHDDECSCRAWH